MEAALVDGVARDVRAMFCGGKVMAYK